MSKRGQTSKRRARQYVSDPGWQEEAYAALADEMNDGSPTDLTIGDFDKHWAEAGARYAADHWLPWPPHVGDFDRYMERKWEQERRERRTR